MSAEILGCFLAANSSPSPGRRCLVRSVVCVHPLAALQGLVASSQTSPGCVSPPCTLIPALCRHWETQGHRELVLRSQHWDDTGSDWSRGNRAGPRGPGWLEGRCPELEREMPRGYGGIFTYLKEKALRGAEIMRAALLPHAESLLPNKTEAVTEALSTPGLLQMALFNLNFSASKERELLLVPFPRREPQLRSNRPSSACFLERENSSEAAALPSLPSLPPACLLLPAASQSRSAMPRGPG